MALSMSGQFGGGKASFFNMTAIIDIVFLLIIFFLIVCQFIEAENFEVEAFKVETVGTETKLRKLNFLQRPIYVVDGELLDNPMKPPADLNIDNTFVEYYFNFRSWDF